MASLNSLSDNSIRAALKAAAASGKPERRNDGGGLFLVAQPTGSGWWRLRFWHGGKEGTLSLGTYPEVSLKDARRRRDEMRQRLARLCGGRRKSEAV